MRDGIAFSRLSGMRDKLSGGKGTSLKWRQELKATHETASDRG